jgi:sec-independent protein translocase protein TatC
MESRMSSHPSDPLSPYIDAPVSLPEAAAEDEAPSQPDEPGKVMSIVEHLDELRVRIMRSLLVFGLALAASLVWGRDIVRFLEIPAGKIEFQVLSLEEPILVYFKVSFYAALALAVPWILFEVSRFVSPGLTRRERRVIAPVVLGGPVLFVLGAAFAYYLGLPPMLHFFNMFGEGMSPLHQRRDFYISLVSSIILYMGLAFQLPIVLFVLSFTGLVTSKRLLAFWRYAIFAAAAVAAIITPDPTAFSMLLVTLALVGLYFVSIVFIMFFGK